MKPNKYRMKMRLVVFSLCCLMFNLSFADYNDIEFNGLKYDLNENTKTATCKGLAEGQKGNGSLVIPDSVNYKGDRYLVTTIGDYAFDYNEGFSGSLVIGNYVTSIGYRAFQACQDFSKSLVIGTSVTNVEDLAFWGIIVENVVSYNTVPPVIGKEVFYVSYMPLYVPDESVDLYKKAEGWSEFLNIYGISTKDGPTTIEVSPSYVELESGTSMQLSYEALPPGVNVNINWISGDPSIASVNDKGEVLANSPGLAIIYAQAENGAIGYATVKVIDSKYVSSVTIVPANIEMVIGEETQLETELVPENAVTEITWLSSDPNVAEVNDMGVVSALSPGVAIIYAVAENGVSGFATVRVVSNEVTSVTIDPDLLELELDETGEFTALIEPSAADTYITWTSSDTSVAVIDNDGIVKAVGAGVSFIYATADNGVAGLAIVKVTDPTGEDNPNLGYGENGVFISTIRIREGDQLGLYAERPTGYEDNDWVYEWYLDGELEAEGRYTFVTAGPSSGWSGSVQEIAQENYRSYIFNTSGDEIITELPAVSVYSRPLTPVELLRKGDGASNTFVAMSQFTDNELFNLGYWFVFGYTDVDGVNHVIATTRERYCHTELEIYDNEENRFWVYTTWTFPDGATITSGLRYLDGSVNESFDRSDFNFTRTSSGVGSFESESEINIYSIEGHYMGKDFHRLAPGLYIIRENKGNTIATRKIIKK